MHWMVISISSYFVIKSFNIQPNDIIMNLLIFRKADCFPIQALYMRSEIKIFSLNFPSPIFPYSMHLWGYIFGIGTPIIGMIKRNRKCFKQFPQYQKILILPFPIMPGQYTTASPFYSVPCPTLIGFILYKTPEFIHFSFKSYLNFQIINAAHLFYCQKIRVRF